MPFSKDGIGWVVFKLFSLCWSLNRLKCDGQCLFLSYCDSCSLCEKSFFTGKECPVECAHRRSPCQKKKYYIYALGQLERLYNAISDKNKTLNLICFVSFKNQNWEMYCFLRSTKENASYLRVSMGWWLLRLSAKILALLRLSVNFFQLRLTKKLKINFFCFKKLNIN